MPDQPLPAPETPAENRRRIQRERAGMTGHKASNRREAFTQAKPSKKAKQTFWAGKEEDRRE